MLNCANNQLDYYDAFTASFFSVGVYPSKLVKLDFSWFFSQENTASGS
jgi:hypothetical protein